jgi:hypothetical protein
MKNKDPLGYYARLGVPPDADQRSIKTAYRRKAMDWHPDRNPDPGATGQFQALNQAYDILSDPGTRASYDTSPMERRPQQPSAGPRQPEPKSEPVVCSRCHRVTAQPRYVIFYVTKGCVVPFRSTIQGIFCSACAELAAFKASALTWLLGWWSIPGPLYTLQALYINMLGGKQPVAINARLAAHQASVLAGLGKTSLARAIAHDALELTRKATSPKESRECAELQLHLMQLLQTIGNDRRASRLKNGWRLLRRPFFLQAAGAACVMAVCLWLSILAWNYVH